MVTYNNISLFWIEFMQTLYVEPDQGEGEKKACIDVVAEPDDVLSPAFWKKNKCYQIKRNQYDPKQEKQSDAINGPDFP